MAYEKPREDDAEGVRGGRSDIAGPLAKVIVYGSIAYITLFSLVALLLVLFGRASPEQAASFWKEILTFILPVLGAWVGAVLAFYFSKENFEAANRSVRDMVGQVSAREKLKKVPAKAAMVPRESIIDLKLDATHTEAHVFLARDLIPSLQGKVTRLPIFTDTDTVKYVIHESTAFKFLYNYRQKKSDQAADPALKDLLDDPDAKRLVTALAFISEAASLADAQDAMKRVEKCQDVFVTGNGRADEPILGWITNAEIAKQVEL